MQTAIARAVLETQLSKLGVVQPELGLDQGGKSQFQVSDGLWILASNWSRLESDHLTCILASDWSRVIT